MIKGLYTAASSMKSVEDNMDVVSNNLSNADTVGFKRKEGVKRSFPELMMSRLQKNSRPREVGSLGTGVHLEETYTDFRPGDFRFTEGELDFAIDGDAFLAVQTPQGVMYTRAGNLTFNEADQLVTQQGYQVLGTDGQPLENVIGEEINIDGNGEIHSGLFGADSIQITAFDDSSLLSKRGENLYELGEAEQLAEIPAEVELKQYYLEDSNVNIVEEMVRMIEVNRLYEANQKTINALDESLGQAVNQIGQVH